MFFGGWGKFSMQLQVVTFWTAAAGFSGIFEIVLGWAGKMGQWTLGGEFGITASGDKDDRSIVGGAWRQWMLLWNGESLSRDNLTKASLCEGTMELLGRDAETVVAGGPS